MRNVAKHVPKAKKPSPNPTAVPGLADPLASDEAHGEGSYSGTRNYQHSLKAYLESANVEKDARDAAPGDAAEARDLEKAEETGRRPGIKTRRPAPGK